MKDEIKPFGQLTVDQQKVAIDLCVAGSVIVTRLPSINQEIFHMLERDFAAQYDVPMNIARYALRSCGQTLFATPWQCMVAKDHENIISTHFKQEPLPGNGDSIES